YHGLPSRFRRKPELKSRGTVPQSQIKHRAAATSVICQYWLKLGSEGPRMRISAIATIVVLAGCGPSLAEPKSTYVPPSAYLTYDCQQLTREARAISSRSASLAGLQQSARTADAGGNESTVIPWPKAFSQVGDENIADKLALMRGQMLAIEEASVRAQCSIQFQRPP